MSYQPVAALRSALAQRRTKPYRVAPIVAHRRRRPRRARFSSPNYAGGLAGSARYLSGDEGLGFSLRPPKWARNVAHTIKRNVTLKRALIAGAVVGAAFIPGVGPAALAAARAAGGAAFRGARFVGREIVGAGGAIERGVVGLFRKKTAPINPDTGGAGGKYGPNPDSNPTDFGPSPSGSTPSGGGGGAPSGGGGSAPSDQGAGPGSYGGGGSAPSGTYGPPAPSDDGGDGGGEPAPEETATTDETATTPAQASPIPVLLGIGALALLARRR